MPSPQTVNPEILAAIEKIKAASSLPQAKKAVSQAKLALHKHHMLTPPVAILSRNADGTETESADDHAARAMATAAIREVYELGALVSIRGKNIREFAIYVSQAKMCYEALPRWILAEESTQQRRIIGLYLLLLLSNSDYATFSCEMEPLLNAPVPKKVVDGREVEAISSAQLAQLLSDDPFLGYPIQLERWLTEGRYDMMWKALQSKHVPGEEYAVFTEILSELIRSEIATSSESAYTSMSILSAKSLLFMESEGAVIQFARRRNWSIRDGLIIFPTPKELAASAAGVDKDESSSDSESEVVEGVSPHAFVGRELIANVQDYGRGLESIV
ncbi:26S proteasome regulatory subunit rpn12 [Ceratocystis platani]|uniref:26S proteasome regulatory subunit rpn12 n=1 Tax=Ceratocystis fimbriata f. sp. platani TaxID=88771 RepID=A0A0F8B1T9_CERFI|nr:26S proteasome regulatory subunit rpn12 [Ceratocystis platani]